ETSFASGPNSSFIAVADFDGDHNLDSLVTNYGFGVNTISFLHGNGNGTFAAPIAYAAGETPEVIRVADMNGDGNLDAVVSNNSYAHGVTVIDGNGDGSFQPPVSYDPAQYNGYVDAVGVSVADFNEDGRPDVAY